MKKVLITGGTGLVGSCLAKLLKEKGYQTAILSRTKSSSESVYSWNPKKRKIEPKAFENTDYIIHLSGANVSQKRWTARRKKIIFDSRVETGSLLFEELQKSGHKLKAFISASAIGYYGAVTSDKIFEETDPPAKDFLAEVCKNWEHTASKFNLYGIRTVKIRLGVVLSSKGGIMQKILTPFKLGLCFILGNGNQYLPWIHVNDLCNIFLKAIEDDNMQGSYNAVAPQHISNKDFCNTLIKVVKIPLRLIRIPKLILKLALGEMSKILLTGSRISSKKIIEAGYKFQFSDIETALKDLIKKDK